MNLTPSDILDELGLLPADEEASAPTGSATEGEPDRAAAATDPFAEIPARPGEAEERRQHPRHATDRPVRLVMLAGDGPLGAPFEARTVDVSRGGMCLRGAAPFLQGSRAVLELQKAGGEPALVGARVRHTTFGHASRMTDDNTSTAGLEFFRLDDDLVRAHFASPTGAVTLTP